MMEFSDFVGCFIGIGFLSILICADANSKGEKLNFFSVFGCITIGLCIFFGSLTKIQEYKRKSKIETATYILQYNKYCSFSSSNPFYLTCISDSTKSIEVSYAEINNELLKLQYSLEYPYGQFKIDSTTFYNRYTKEFLVVFKEYCFYKSEGFYSEPKYITYRVCTKPTGPFSSQCDNDLGGELPRAIR